MQITFSQNPNGCDCSVALSNHFNPKFFHLGSGNSF